MKAVLEKDRRIKPGSSVVAFEHHEPSFAFNWHYHPELELVWILSGSGRRFEPEAVKSLRSLFQRGGQFQSTISTIEREVSA